MLPGRACHLCRHLLTVAVVVVPLVAARPAVASPRAVTGVAWLTDSNGTTVVTVTTDTELEPGDYRAYGMPSPPRVVVVLRGISRAMEPAGRVIGDGTLLRVRSGLHRPRTGNELHLVFDLAAADVELLELGHAGGRLRAVFGRRPQPTTSGAPTPVSQPTARAMPTPSPLPSPESPTPRVSPAAVLTPALFATPTPTRETPLAQHVTAISASPRGDGSTLLLVTADGPLPDGCVRVLEVADDPGRIIVTLRGLSAPDLPRTLELNAPLLQEIRLIHDAETSAGELHLVLHLSDGTVSVTDLNQVGANLVLRLARQGPPSRSP